MTNTAPWNTAPATAGISTLFANEGRRLTLSRGHFDRSSTGASAHRPPKHPADHERPPSEWASVEGCIGPLPSVPAPTETNAVGMEATFLDEIYRLGREQLTDRALREIFVWVDQELRAGGELRCNAVLDAIDEGALDEDLLVGFLTATHPVRALLPARDGLVTRARARLLPEIGVEATTELFRELA